MQVSVLGPVEVRGRRPAGSDRFARGSRARCSRLLALSRGLGGFHGTVSSTGCGERRRRRRRRRWSSCWCRRLRKALAGAGATGRRSSRAGAATSCTSGPGGFDATRFVVADRRRGMPREALRAVAWRTAPGRRRRAVRDRRDPPPRGAASEGGASWAVDRDLAAGRHHEVVGELDLLVARDPLREATPRTAHARPVSLRPAGSRRSDAFRASTVGARRGDRGRTGA